MGENYLSDPITLEEQYLKAIAENQVSDLPEAITLKEQYLKAIAEKQTTGLPDPITLKEQYLKAIAENGGGSSIPDAESEEY